MSLKLSILVMLYSALVCEALYRIERQAQPFQPTPKPPAKPKNLEPQYQFGYLIDNNIEGNLISHNEHSTDGVIVGVYSYDDGNMYRTVTYEADHRGFRILKDERVPSQKVGELNGVVHVNGYFGDKTYEYTFDKSARRPRSVVAPAIV